VNYPPTPEAMGWASGFIECALPLKKFRKAVSKERRANFDTLPRLKHVGGGQSKLVKMEAGINENRKLIKKILRKKLV